MSELADMFHLLSSY